MSLGRIAVLVSNDLAFDQRVRKTCAVLAEEGWEPVLIGRRMRRSDDRGIDRAYPTRRLWLGFRSGPLFYLALHVGLARALRRCRREGGVTAVWANDLDTLGPAVRAARRWGWSIAYDSHEWFTEAEGLKGHPVKKAVWRWWERRCFRSLDRMITVNGAIAAAYRDAYGIEVGVVPNVPERLPDTDPLPREELGWPEDRSVLLIQGAFMDRDRGALDAVRAMVHLEDCHLALVGAGPEHAAARHCADGLGVGHRVHVHDRMPFERLRRCTAAADVGLSLDRPTVDNFRYSLPNKLFDYLHAGLPVVCSDLPVAGRFVRDEGIGVVAAGAEGDEGIARAVADAVLEVLRRPPSAEHLADVASRHHWDAHRSTLIEALHAPRRS